jgi:FkbM family methyltransferase
MHRQSLLGLNYGRGGVHDSGEDYALAYAAERMPDPAVVVDVGANIGDWSLAARETWPDARVVAFEPSRTSFLRLTQRVDGVECVRAACGETPGQATLYAVPGLPELSSLHDRDLVAHGMTMTATETVPVVTLDGWCAENGVDRVDYLKVDAEGHDLAVLHGAAGLLPWVRFVQFEFGGCNIDSRSFLRDFVRLLEPTHRLHRMLSDGLEPVDYSERDEVFITSNFLAEARRPTPR